MMYEKYWKSICQIYLITKHYLLLAEEISDDCDTFLQPLKEHRDTFDHIVRVYGNEFADEKKDDIESYCENNMKKALGHEYRAFFDTADWLSYICRKKIRLILQGKSREEIKEKYSEYDELKSFLIAVPAEIAKIREKKDISDNEQELIDEVENYRQLLDVLLGYHKTINDIFA